MIDHRQHRLLVASDDLHVLGRIPVGYERGFGEVGDDNRAAVFAKRSVSVSAARLRQRGDLAGNLNLRCLNQRFAVGNKQRG